MNVRNIAMGTSCKGIAKNVANTHLLFECDNSHEFFKMVQPI